MFWVVIDAGPKLSSTCLIESIQVAAVRTMDNDVGGERLPMDIDAGFAFTSVLQRRHAAAENATTVRALPAANSLGVRFTTADFAALPKPSRGYAACDDEQQHD
jgi:hypothetical protein